MKPYPDEIVPDIDLGDDHYLTFTCWHPDDLPANRELYGIPTGQPMPRVEKWGACVRHYRPDGTLCEGCIEFDGEWQRRAHECYARKCAERGETPRSYVAWAVESWDPLTVSPSLLCKAPTENGGVCGDHGFIRGGKWARA